MVTKLNCPTCKKEIEYTEEYPFRPFCSERCKLIDLGEWADEQHKIKGSSIYDDILSKDLEDPDL
ncbi:DNA gyrase inhibitor YacG [Aestuariicella hydrocarbonica]|uniref:DNA gyrase inhibitor YacG n=1 Tax=Pseudomaricurvus hydrocarbonicus TaxID=1470433 RepID=A0A9E5MGS9_9GAMM|nr:DNA gyrase inhibitor YacG [Aestuariicella hydrocarbonica]NHO65091.1 DNA gyrase inhibitor YacG [Aestuariicella hydrocarbonica]